MKHLSQYVAHALFACLLSLLILPSCDMEKGHDVMKAFYGKTDDGTDVYLFTMRNAAGIEAKITNFGGVLVSLMVPDKNGTFADVVLGYDSLDGYISDKSYFGALIGRYGNRIGKGTFELDGTRYTLATNNGENHLHGGMKGFDKRVWDARTETGPGRQSVVLSYLSKDGEEGYPGNLSVTVSYTLTDDDQLRIVYSATTDKPTVVNLTHHSYFNLAGAGTGDILGHRLMINGHRFTPVDAGLIPTGELRDVGGTPMDFLEPTAIGARIDDDDEQLRFAGGYDHNWVIDGKPGELGLAAEVHEESSGRVMRVLTTEPGLQFYSGNFLDGTVMGKKGLAYEHRYGFCLETQHFPDSPNKPEFPSTVLRPGETYATTTIYEFSIRK